jgi:hypothetical protein
MRLRLYWRATTVSDHQTKRERERGELANIAKTVSKYTRKRAEGEAIKVNGSRALGEARRQIALKGESTPALEETCMAAVEQCAAGEAMSREAEAMLHEAVRARQTVERQLRHLYRDNLDGFLADAVANLSAPADEAVRRAVAAAEEARQLWQAAKGEFSLLAPALSEALRVRDEAEGVYRPTGYYQQAVTLPPFPLITNAAVCHPSGVDLLQQPVRPEPEEVAQEMTRIWPPPEKARA